MMPGVWAWAPQPGCGEHALQALCIGIVKCRRLVAVEVEDAARVGAAVVEGHDDF